MTSFAIAQRDYDYASETGTDLTFREECEIDQQKKDLWTGLAEEIESEEFAPTLNDIRAAFPNATARDLALIQNRILNRVADNREGLPHA